MSQKNVRLSGFNHYPQQACHLFRPERYRELASAIKPIIARGLGNSYGDCALNNNGNVITTERLNRFLAFDTEQGILTAEAGVSLQEILKLIVPAGWFLPVTPGTQYATLGGCIAVDAHGKNHPSENSFGKHVQWLDLIIANGTTIRCSHYENSDFFWATVGGLGLTGIIGIASLKLIPINSSQLIVNYQTAQNLEEILTKMQQCDEQYNVAWFDAYAKQPGRGIIMSAQHAEKGEIKVNSTRSKLSIPGLPFGSLLNKYTIAWFNQLYYSRYAKQSAPQTIPFEKYFYPLDSVQHWNRLYGKKGFIQYQCSLPFENALTGFNELLSCLQTNEQLFFLAVLKKFGASNSAPLSFASPGFTLALDIPIKNNTLFTTLQKMDEIIIKHGGRVYLAKDARLSPQAFRAMYPRYPEWLAIKQQLDPENYFRSSLSQRLEITTDA